MIATPAQIRDLAQCIANQADALELGGFAHPEIVSGLILNNAQTLLAWAQPKGE